MCQALISHCALCTMYLCKILYKHYLDEKIWGNTKKTENRIFRKPCQKTRQTFLSLNLVLFWRELVYVVAILAFLFCVFS